jgi:hypothetical protein
MPTTPSTTTRLPRILPAALLMLGLAISATAATDASAATERTAELSPAIRSAKPAPHTRPKPHARAPRRLFRELRRGGARRSLARAAAYDPRISTACRFRDLSVGTTIYQGATAGARPGEAVYVRTLLWHGATGRWLNPGEGWTRFIAPSYWTIEPSSVLVGLGGGSVAPAIQTWSASRGYEWNWSPPLLGRDYYWCDF